MSADVSSLLRLMNRYKEDNLNVDSSGGKSSMPITRDFLGGGSCHTLDLTELDLDMQVPTGWEKRLDLKSGKIYLQKCETQNKHQLNEALPKFQDLNFLATSKHPLNFIDESSLDLKLFLSSSTRSSTSTKSSSSPSYQSICTLDKVKSALERAERQTDKKRSVSITKSSSPVLSNSTSSLRELEIETDSYEVKSSSFAAGCPSCLLYVLIPRDKPKCPRCRTIVPYPEAMKKPRIDLNISIQ